MRRLPVLAAVLGAALAAAAAAQPQATPPTRGALLYGNHCVTCHTVQMHWRTHRRARDWDTLRAQVRRWQAEGRLGWPEEDIDAVADYLNDTIYRFPRPDGVAQH